MLEVWKAWERGARLTHGAQELEARVVSFPGRVETRLEAKVNLDRMEDSQIM